METKTKIKKNLKWEDFKFIPQKIVGEHENYFSSHIAKYLGKEIEVTRIEIIYDYIFLVTIDARYIHESAVDKDKQIYLDL